MDVDQKELVNLIEKLITLVEKQEKAIIRLEEMHCIELSKYTNSNDSDINYRKLINDRLKSAAAIINNNNLCSCAKAGFAYNGKYENVLASLWHVVDKMVLREFSIDIVKEKQYRHKERLDILQDKGLLKPIYDIISEDSFFEFKD